MASIHLQGTLVDSLGEIDVGAIMTFTHLTNTGETIATTKIDLIIPPNGFYSIDVEYGQIRIDYTTRFTERFIATVIVNQDSTATTIPELLNAAVPVTDPVILEMQDILADAVAAADTSEAFADQLTTFDLIGSVAVFAPDTNFRTKGYLTSGDGGAGHWVQNGVTAQPVSQSPAQLGDALLNDGNGNQWVMILDNDFEFETFAELEASTIGNVGQRLICRETANTEYIIQPTSYTIGAGDALLSSGLVAKLQRNKLYNQVGIGVSSLQQTGFNHVAFIGDSLSDETFGPLTSFRNAFYSEFGYGGQYWAFLDGSPGFTSVGFTRNPTTTELSYTPDLRARADDNFDATKFASILDDSADYDSVRLYYLEQPLGCSFAVGPTALGASGALTVVNTLSATTQVNYVDVPKASGGGGAVTVRSTVDGKICLFGVELIKENQNTYGGRVTRMAKGGAKAAEIAALDATQYTQWLTWFNPEVVFINLGMNDRLISTPAEIMAFITTIDGRIPAGVKRVLVAPNAPADYVSSSLPVLAGLLRSYAEANDYGFIDNTDTLGTYERAVNKLLMADAVHPNDSGRSLTSGNYLGYIGLPASANVTVAPVFVPIGGAGLNFTGDLSPLSGLNMTVGQTLKIYTLGLNRSFTDAIIEIKTYSKDQSSSLLSETRFALKNGSSTANYVTEITPIETDNVYKYTSSPGVNEITHLITAAIVSNLAEVTFEISTGNVGGDVYISASYISPKAVVEGFGVIEN